MMYYEPDERFSASTWLSTIADAMYNEYLTYWEQQNVREGSELSHEQRRQLGLLVELAAALRPSLHSLSLDASIVDRVRVFLRELGVEIGVDEQFAGRVVQTLRSHPIVSHGLEIELAREAADRLLSGAESRFAVLLGLIASRSLSQRASSYLDRATRLYLWGFEPEAVVMCAAVLEAAYPERFSALEMFRLQVRKRNDEYEPHEYEAAALAAGVFTKEQRDLARTIRRARNDVVHTVPAVALTAERALVNTASLLAALFPAS